MRGFYGLNILGQSWHACHTLNTISLSEQVYYNDTRIQLLDLPGIIEGAAYGRGRGREVRYGSEAHERWVMRNARRCCL